MKFLEEHRLEITALTPVHIGCGEDYTPTDYVIDEDALFAFNSAVVSQALPEHDRAVLLKLVQGEQQDDILQKLQRFFQERREPLMAKASHYLPVVSGVADLYRTQIGQTAGWEEGGKKVINKLEIERTFYNPINQKPVIPGSSLKGAIRTALLDSINSGNPLPREEEREQVSTKKNRTLQRRLFKGEFNSDPMRLVHLADTEVVKSDAITSKIIFAVNCPRKERTGDSHAKKSSLSTLLETVPESELRAFRSRLTIHKVGQIRAGLKKIPATGLYWTMDQIAKACNRFYLPLLMQEMAMVRERKYVSPDWDERMKNLLVEIKPMLDANKAMLLRIGKHSGAEAVTLNGVRSTKINPPATVWLGADTKDRRSGMTPFGWMLIEVDPLDKPPELLENFCLGQHNDDQRQWLEKTRQRIADARKKCEDRKIQAEEKRKNQLAEEKARREKTERLAAMTDPQRKLEELRNLFEEEKARGGPRPSGSVAESVAKLLSNASGWPKKEDKHAAADLAESIYMEKEMGLLKGKKGRERKEKIKKLRDS